MAVSVTADRVIRYFGIDLCAGGPRDRHDGILNALLDEPNAVEALSGHTGFVVAIENDTRPEDEIIRSLSDRLSSYE